MRNVAMPLDADARVDRLRLKRKLIFWRIVALLVVAAAIVYGGSRFVDGFGDYVAQVDVKGVIVDSTRRDRVLSDIYDDPRAKAVIVRINSPGGTVVGGEKLYRQLRRIAERKPVVAVMGQLATSAGYMTAIGADWVIARDGTITGSIGVILQTPEITEMLERLGIKMTIVKSGPLKAQPNPFERFPDRAREATEAVVRDMYEMFVGMVVERRKLGRERVLELADGRIYTGRQAKANGLVDALGGIETAREWLDLNHKVSRSLPVRRRSGGRDYGLSWMTRALLGRNAAFVERVSLDGLVSVWHPSLR
jgi:protease-4